MLYTLIAFVALFVATTTIAVIYYVKFEEQVDLAQTARSDLEEMISGAEQRKGLGRIVGMIPRNKSALGMMSDYLDEMVYLIAEGPAEDTSAEVKVETANRKVKETLELLARGRPAATDITPGPATNEFVELLVNEQFSTAAEAFDETMKNTVPAEGLEQIWKTTAVQTGAFKQQIGVRTEKEAEYDIELVTCEFEKGPLDIKVVYNSERQVTGLFFVPTPADVLESYQASSQPPAQNWLESENIDPNTTTLTRIIGKLRIGLDNVTSAKLATQQQLQELQNRFDDAMASNYTKEQTLLAEKEKYEQQVKDITRNYNELKTLMEQASEQRVQSLMSQLDEEKATRKQQQQLLLQTQAKLKMSQGRMKLTQNELEKLVPPPDSEAPAFKADSKIMLVDYQSRIVHLNIGSNDHVYRGLTFSVYEKNAPIPRDGKGKAEIEVFNIEKNISAARIIHSQRGKSIVVDDIVANLIWDSDRANTFAVSGEFDLNNDGNIDYGGVDKIKTLIERWGGQVSDAVAIDTDFVILGKAPRVRRKPTFEEMEIYPTAMEEYEASVQRLADYNVVQQRAQDLSIPIFNTERFLYFIGYKAQSSRAGAF
jgi:hypothetical protein